MLVISSAVMAQEQPPTTDEVKGQVDSLTEAVTEAKNTLEALARLRITGYVQAQYVDSQVANAETFSVRRGRLAFQYQLAPTSRLYIQPDISSSGVALRDAYVELTEPWTPWRHTLTAGQFKVPFGFEIRQSSRDREMPERTRLITTLFPGERDRGVMVNGAGFGEKFNYRLAVLNGNGIATASDADEEKDIAGRVGFSLGAVDFGVSAYQGTQLNLDKERYGADLQVITPVPGLGLRAEYIKGTQPATSGARDVEGYFAYAIQNVGTRHQFVLRYDTYDPNTNAGGDSVDTIGGSYIFHWDANLKVMFAYELPDSEINDPDDNVMTVRMQFAF